MRSVFYKKYNHPKECLIQNGVVNDDLYRMMRGLTKNTTQHFMHMDDENQEQKVCNLLYPFGITLTCLKPSFPIIHSGPISYPANKCICAMYQPKNKKGGRLVVMGSTKMFEDE